MNQKSSKNNRSTLKPIRLNDAEIMDLDIASKKWGMDVSSILRNCFRVVAGRGFLDIEGKVEAQLSVIHRELKKQGQNINQLV